MRLNITTNPIPTIKAPLAHSTRCACRLRRAQEPQHAVERQCGDQERHAEAQRVGGQHSAPCPTVWVVEA